MKIIVADPRRTETAEVADLHLPILPGTDVALFNGMLHVMLWEGLVDQAYIAAHTDRKSTRLNSSHANISYAVFCLKKKKINQTLNSIQQPPCMSQRISIQSPDRSGVRTLHRSPRVVLLCAHSTTLRL